MVEMMAILSVVSFLLAGIFGMVSVVLWFRFDISGIEKKRKGRAGSPAETERLDRGHPAGEGKKGPAERAGDEMSIHMKEENKIYEGEE